MTSNMWKNCMLSNSPAMLHLRGSEAVGVGFKQGYRYRCVHMCLLHTYSTSVLTRRFARSRQNCDSLALPYASTQALQESQRKGADADFAVYAYR